MKSKCKPKLGQKIHGKLYLTDEEKLIIVKDYLSGNEIRRDVYRRYTGHDYEHGKISQWLRKFNLKDKESGTFEPMPKKTNTPIKAESDIGTEILKKRVKELEDKLAKAEIKATAYSTMVDIAERELKIQIRKKYNTKP